MTAHRRDAGGRRPGDHAPRHQPNPETPTDDRRHAAHAHQQERHRDCPHDPSRAARPRRAARARPGHRCSSARAAPRPCAADRPTVRRHASTAGPRLERGGRRAVRSPSSTVDPSSAHRRGAAALQPEHHRASTGGHPHVGVDPIGAHRCEHHRPGAHRLADDLGCRRCGPRSRPRRRGAVDRRRRYRLLRSGAAAYRHPHDRGRVGRGARPCGLLVIGTADDSLVATAGDSTR